MPPKISARFREVSLNNADGVVGVVVDLIMAPGGRTMTKKVGLQVGEGYETADGDIPQDRKQGVTLRPSGLPTPVRFDDVDAPMGTEDAVLKVVYGDRVVGTATREQLLQIAERDIDAEVSRLRGEVERLNKTVDELLGRVEQLEANPTPEPAEDEPDFEPVSPDRPDFGDLIDLVDTVASRL